MPPAFDIDEEPTLPRGPLVGGRYRLGRMLGQGGMAMVYEATDSLTGRRVALKVLRPGGGIPHAHERFERELRLMSAVAHPHCVRLLDSGDDPVPFAALELIEGNDLRQAMRRAIPVTQVLELTLQLLHGLAAVHEAGIVHRDIKSENVMLTRQPDGSDRLVLIDFGAAIRADAALAARKRELLTASDQMLGTPTVMSPEQFQGQPASFRSDLYAVGVLMFEMLAGYLPFPDTNLIEVMMAKAQPIPSLPSTVPPSIAWLVQSLLAPDPEQRPESSAEAIEIVMYARDELRQTMVTTTWHDLLPVRKPLANDH